MDRSGWASEPSADRVTVHFEDAVEQPAMRSNRGPVPATFGDDQPTADGRRIPAPIARDPRGEAAFPVERPKELVDIDDRRLELNDEERPRGGVPCEPVDDATLAEDRERDL